MEKIRNEKDAKGEIIKDRIKEGNRQKKKDLEELAHIKHSYLNIIESSTVNFSAPGLLLKDCTSHPQTYSSALPQWFVV